MSSASFGTTSSGIDTAAPRSAAQPSSRAWWPWIVTFLAFPPAGYLGHIVAGPVDDLRAAVFAGVVSGGVLGLVQWALLRRRGTSARWISGTAAGFGVGLAVGAALVSYRTDRPSLAVMGAVSGLGVGLLQANALGATARRSLVWGVATAGLWPIGWVVSSGVIDPADQWPVFGASGALLVAVLQSLFIERVLPLGPRRAKSGRRRLDQERAELAAQAASPAVAR
jgi:hypothetical protein